MRIDRSKIRGSNNLVRDEKTGAILNTNREEIARFQRERAMENRLNILEKRVQELESLLGDNK